MTELSYDNSMISWQCLHFISDPKVGADLVVATNTFEQQNPAMVVEYMFDSLLLIVV